MTKDFTEEVIRISGLGLLETDINVIRSVFLLSSDLQERFDFEGNGTGTTADIIFINADDRRALTRWREIHSKNKAVKLIVIGSQRPHVSGLTFLERPLSLKKLVEVLDTLTSTASSAGCAPEYASLRIHVVDDSFSVRTYLEQTLQKLASAPVFIGFSSSGEEAKENMMKKSYDLVFLDVVMPGIDGYKLCKWIKTNYDCTVVMLTSKKSPFDKVRGTMSGCDDYVTKPPNEDRLKKILVSASERLTQNRKQEKSAGNEEPGSNMLHAK